MAQQAGRLWKLLLRSLAAGRFAGGSALIDPLGLLAIQRERLAALRRPGGRALRKKSG
jgi:hypothetical protein